MEIDESAVIRIIITTGDLYPFSHCECCECRILCTKDSGDAFVSYNR